MRKLFVFIVVFSFISVGSIYAEIFYYHAFRTDFWGDRVLEPKQFLVYDSDTDSYHRNTCAEPLYFSCMVSACVFPGSENQCPCTKDM